MKKIIRNPAGLAHGTTPDPQVRHPTVRACGAHTLRFAPKIRSFGARPRLQCPNYDHLIVL